MLIHRPLDWLKTHMWVLDITKFILIVILLGMAISFNIQAAHQATETRKIGDNTNTLVKKIEALSADNKQLAQQNKDLSQQLNAKADNINAHVDCIVALFLPNKPLPTNADIEGCKSTVSTSVGVQSSTSPKQSSTSSSQPQAAPSTTSTQSSNPAPKPSTVKNVCSKIPVIKKLCT